MRNRPLTSVKFQQPHSLAIWFGFVPVGGTATATRTRALTYAYELRQNSALVWQKQTYNGVLMFQSLFSRIAGA